MKVYSIICENMIVYFAFPFCMLRVLSESLKHMINEIFVVFLTNQNQNQRWIKDESKMNRIMNSVDWCRVLDFSIGQVLWNRVFQKTWKLSDEVAHGNPGSFWHENDTWIFSRILGDCYLVSFCLLFLGVFAIFSDFREFYPFSMTKVGLAVDELFCPFSFHRPISWVCGKKSSFWAILAKSHALSERMYETAFHQILKWPTNNLKPNKTWKNDFLDLIICLGKFFWVGKPMMKPKILNSKILTPFVTSWTPKTTQNGLKSPKMQIKLVKVIVLT